MKHAILFSLLVLFSSCSRMGLSDYKKENLDQVAGARDEEECGEKAKGARASGFTDSVIGMDTMWNKGFDECMTARGYTRR